MPGAWELRQSHSVFSAILHTEVTSMAWSFGFKNLIIPGPPTIPISGQPFDMARNTACMRFLESGCEWLFFLDSDVIPPRDAVLRLLKHNLHIVSGMYCRRSPPVALPVMLRGGNWLTQFPMGTLQEVELVGAGCLLIHREVIEKLPPIDPQRGKHWFDWRVDMPQGVADGTHLSEDFSFNLHARRHGYKIYVDTSIHCRHAGLGEATYGNFQPLDCTPVT
jgi:hypothetical protein